MPRDRACSGQTQSSAVLCNYRRRGAIDPDMIASFLLLPHATIRNLPLSRKDVQDIAALIVGTKR